jgi:predicted transcriptional regulator
MTIRKISISLTDELDDALESIALSQRESKSRIIENYLREHKVVQHHIDIVRSEPETGVLALSKKAVEGIREKMPITA